MFTQPKVCPNAECGATGKVRRSVVEQVVAFSLLAAFLVGCEIPEGVVRIRTEDSLGSGFVVAAADSRSAAVTNAHVCVRNYESVVMSREFPKIAKKLSLSASKSQTFQAEVVALDFYNDLCLLLVYGYLKPLPVYKGADLPKGEFVTVLSPSPLPKPTARLIGRDKAVYKDNMTLFHQSSYILDGQGFKKGQSGSPVINKAGEVVGVFWGKNLGRDNIGYMVGSDALNKFLELNLGIYRRETPLDAKSFRENKREANYGR